MVEFTWFIGIAVIWFGYFYINDLHEMGKFRTLLSLLLTLAFYLLVIVPLIKYAYTIGGN